GAASATIVSAGEYVLTVEFKINLLRTARGEKLRCHAQILKPGRMFTVTESEVYMIEGASEKLAAKATITIANLPKNTD
ncbi:MAG TPA: PaaI family thioesterase, partial [Aggregatilineales bacterium]|nr:PaaI family thioesterase [Aggregatilineales bacterium]